MSSSISLPLPSPGRLRRPTQLQLAGWLALLAILASLVPALSPGAAYAASPLAAAGAPTRGGPFTGVWTGGPSSAEAAALDDLGAGWARVTVTWNQVEPANGVFVWGALDQQMALASGGGRRSVLALVRDNPSWAAATPCTIITDAERSQLASFMSALAGRYRGVVWQLYNEMDNVSPAADALYGLGGCFGTLSGGVTTSVGRTRYARAIESASAAARAADPTAQIAAGGVASGGFTDTTVGGNFDKGFAPGVLAQLKQDNSLASLDYVTVHYYSSQGGSYANAGVDLFGRINQLRQDSLAAGLTAAELKPVISDELSYTGIIGVSTSDPNNAFNQAQRAYVPKLLARAVATDVRAAFWFWIQDSIGGLGSDNAYGLKDVNGTPKPAYRAMRYFNSVVTRASQFVRPLDLSTLSPKLEGYEFTTADGHSLHLVWNQQDGAQLSYVVPGTVASVTDPEGNSVGFNGNTVTIGSEPRFITYTPVPVQLLPQPVRLVDTRAGSGLLGAGQYLRGYTTPNCYKLAGAGDVPATAAGVLLNITTTGHPGDGYVTLYPAGSGIPSTSNLNFSAFEYAIANNATVKIGSGGQVCAVGMLGTQLILDAVGYLADVGASGAVQLLPQPVRLVDTRAGSGSLGAGQALLGYQTPNCFTVAGAGGVPSSALGILLNITTTGHSADGYVTVYPGGGAVAQTSSLNFLPAKYATANAATVKVGAGGQICAVGLAGTQLIVDAVGYLASVTGTPPVQLLTQPVRLVDTRAGSGYLGAGQALQAYTTANCFTVAGLSGIPANAAGLLLNVTTTGHPGEGYVTIFPAGVAIPPTSNLNFAGFEYAIANGATVKIGTGGQVCAVGMPGTQLILDAAGYLTP